jgi:hypothetical protein
VLGTLEEQDKERGESRHEEDQEGNWFSSPPNHKCSLLCNLIFFLVSIVVNRYENRGKAANLETEHKALPWPEAGLNKDRAHHCDESKK